MFHLCAAAGLLVACLLTASLAQHQKLSLWVLGGVVVLSLGISLTLVLLTKLLSGREILVNYHHQISILTGTGLFLWLLDQPILSYLDVSALGVGMCIAFGRLGCLANGCCHGRPSHWGICYATASNSGHLPPSLARARLLPVPLMESVWVFGIVIVGSALILNGVPSGVTVSMYVAAYAAGRFGLEFIRGDVGRPYTGGFSEAQWTSLFLSGGVVVAGWMDLWPLFHPHWIATLLLAGTMIVVFLIRWGRSTSMHRWLHAQHVLELAVLLDDLACRAPQSTHRSVHHFPVAQTSLGIQLSTGAFETGSGRIFHYTISSRHSPLTSYEGETLARLILCLRHPGISFDIRSATGGIFHLMAREGDPGQATTPLFRTATAALDRSEPPASRTLPRVLEVS